MTAVLDRVTDVQTRLLDNIESVQERLVSAQERVADVVTPRIADVEVPFADRLPTAAEMVDNYFSFVTKATKMNKRFAEKVVDAWAMPTKPAAKKTAKTAKTA